MHVYTYPIRAASDKNLCLSSFVAPLRNVCWKEEEWKKTQNRIWHIVHVVHTYMKSHIVHKCTHTWILMTPRKEGRQTTQHDTAQDLRQHFSREKRAASELRLVPTTSHISGWTIYHKMMLHYIKLQGTYMYVLCAKWANLDCNWVRAGLRS